MNKFPLEYSSYLDVFIESFVPKIRQDRWVNILAKHPHRWRSLSTWDFWNINFLQKTCCYEWKYTLKDLANLDFIKIHLNRTVLVIHIGHDDRGFSFPFLYQILRGEYWILEGFIIVNENLAIVINHDGGVCVCRKQT